MNGSSPPAPRGHVHPHDEAANELRVSKPGYSGIAALRHFEPPSGKYLLGESGQPTPSHHQVCVVTTGEEREHVEPTGPRGDVPG